jgi:antitoxin HicB
MGVSGRKTGQYLAVVRPRHSVASRLGLSEAAVRRLVDPDHASRLDGVVAALSVLGRGLIIEDQKQVAA